ncbi:MAG: dihydroorotate dehydrogenase electron transfer subunit [Bacteroidales bacterium]|jgi:dihydroorotate dehydrogenase electron transfer subunit|nr:dihydroorotate dehydrogenase electron transfer subunit [Bacteroidales bacterium]
MGGKFVDNFRVIEIKALNSTNFLITIESENDLPEIHPGQFVNIDIKNAPEVFLRRPFSIFEVDYSKKTISLIIKILGKGSKKITEIKQGETLNIIYPLGKGFTYPKTNDNILLVGGGSGVAPMLFLAKKSGIKNVDIILGAKTKQDHINVDEYSKYASLYFTTEDGSLGEKGYVTNHTAFQQLSKFTKIYACGPYSMMKTIAKEAQKAGVFCEVSLENLMACGFGVCLCCIEPTKKGNLCVCTQGPVFNVNDLKW